MQFDPIFVTLGLIILTSVLLYFLVFSKSKNSKLLIIGPQGTGKTALFFRLKNEKFVSTVPSIEPNSAKIKHTIVTDWPSSMPITGIEKPKGVKLILFLVSPADLRNSALKLLEVVEHFKNARVVLGISKIDDGVKRDVVLKGMAKELEVCKKANLGDLQISDLNGVLCFSAKSGDGIEKLSRKLVK